MNITLHQAFSPVLDDQDVLVLLMDAQKPLEFPAEFPEAVQAQLKPLIERSGFNAKVGELLPVHQLSDFGFQQVLLVGLGNKAEMTAAQSQTVATTLYKSLTARADYALVHAGNLPTALLEPFALALSNAAYNFLLYKSKKPEHKIKGMSLYLPDASEAEQQQLAFVSAIHRGQSLARNLANQPANICHPEYMAEQALELASHHPELKVTILTPAEMAELGMHSFLAVAQGSERPGRLILIEYNGDGAPDAAPYVLVGKGITFDTGGISIKPAAGMDEMKFDMSGAASVMGVMQSLCAAKLPIRVVGALACAENMPSGHATRPGDIVTSMSGQTIEILNTDAEGRLVLCDTLTYIQRYEPRLIIDIATLTGACIVALGKVVSGLFSPDDALAQELIDAGQHIHDRVWRMPVWDDYQELLDSPVADIGNIGGPTAGSVTAACFLARFTKGYRWAHLDIAGTSHISGANKGATGRPVPLLMQFLRQQANSSPASAA